MNHICPLITPSIEVVYIFVPSDPLHQNLAQRFVDSYRNHPPGAEHTTTIICNGGPPSPEQQALFNPLPNVKFLEHDDSGWDIGGFVKASHHSHAEMMLCLGGPGYVKRTGWLARMREAWVKHGVGFYGSLATYEVRPHINTSGFWCHPQMLRSYPHRVVTKEERYAFEHGYNSLWLTVLNAGLPALLVTWCGEYNWWHWRLPNNVYRRGDQSNCLTYFKHTDLFDIASPADREGMSALADTVTDPHFISRPNVGGHVAQLAVA